MIEIIFTFATEGFLIGHIHYSTGSPCHYKEQKVDKLFNRLHQGFFFLFLKQILGQSEILDPTYLF